MAALARSCGTFTGSAGRQGSPFGCSHGPTPSGHVVPPRAQLLCPTARASSQSISQHASPQSLPRSSLFGQPCSLRVGPGRAHWGSIRRAGTGAPSVQCNLVVRHPHPHLHSAREELRLVACATAACRAHLVCFLQSCGEPPKGSCTLHREGERKAPTCD